MGACRAAGCARHGRAVFDRHLHPGVLGHRAIDRGDACRDAADAVGVPLRLRLHEPVPRCAVGQLRASAGRAVGYGGVHARVARLCAVAEYRPARAVPRAAGPVDRCRHRGVACGDSRHVPARRGATRHVAGHDLLWRRAGHCAHRRRLFVRAPGLAQRVLVSGGGRLRTVYRQLQVATRDAALKSSAAIRVQAPDARLLGLVLRPALSAACAGQRRAVQRHVSLRARCTGFSR